MAYEIRFILKATINKKLDHNRAEFVNKPVNSSWRIGLVGFSYPEWEKTLYARRANTRMAPKSRENHRLATYAMHFNAVEINTTFYGIPSIDTVRSWADVTPADFRFCVKVPREVTHGPTPPGALAAAGGPPPGHLLHDRTITTARRFVETIRPLGGKLGAVLAQFPPKFAADRRDELMAFVDRLGGAAPLAVELRHPAWLTAETGAALRDRGVCWAGTDESPRHEVEKASDAKTGDKHELRPIMPTADFLYIRWLGRHGQFRDRSKEHFDPSSRLRWWAEHLREILDRNPRVRTVYGFFDNDFAGHAPATARRFKEILGLPVSESSMREREGPTLFG
ncbi:MAG: DUF72 domain-containing protein [Thermomicrobiales bacterium]